MIAGDRVRPSRHPISREGQIGAPLQRSSPTPSLRTRFRLLRQNHCGDQSRLRAYRRASSSSVELSGGDRPRTRLTGRLPSLSKTRMGADCQYEEDCPLKTRKGKATGRPGTGNGSPTARQISTPRKTHRPSISSLFACFAGNSPFLPHPLLKVEACRPSR